MNEKRQFQQKETKLKIILIILAFIVISLWISIYLLQKGNIKNLLHEEKLHGIFILKTIQNNIKNNIYSKNLIETLYLNRNEILIKAALQTDNMDYVDSLRQSLNIPQFFIVKNNHKIITALPRDASLNVELDEVKKSSDFVLLESHSSWKYLASFQNNHWYIAGGKMSELKDISKPIELSTLFKSIGKQIFDLSDQGKRDKHIVYIVIQDKEGILAATSNISRLQSFQSDKFLKQVIDRNKTRTRLYDLKSENSTKKVYEVALPYNLHEGDKSVIRLGISYKRIRQFKQKQNVLFIIYSLVFLSILILEIIFYKYYARVNKLRQELELKRHLAEIGKLGGEVAHEIKNPLNAIYMTLQRIQSNYPNNSTNITPQSKQKFDKSISIVFVEIDRLNNIIEKFLSFSRPMDLKYESINISNFIQNFKNIFSDECKKLGIKCKIKSAEELSWEFDRQAIKTAIINLIKNAIESFDPEQENKIMKIDYSVVKDTLQIEILDNGSGISPKTQEQMWNLYFTTKSQGSGIGLPIVKKIVEEHFGKIDIESKLDNGTTVRIILPARNYV